MPLRKDADEVTIQEDNKDLRRLPILLAAMLLIFTAMLVTFYIRSVSAVRSVLESQMQELTDRIGPGLANNYGEIIREASFLTRNRLLPLLYGSAEATNQDLSAEAQNFLKWFRHQTNKQFEHIAFTDSLGATIYPKSQQKADAVDVQLQGKQESINLIQRKYDLTELDKSNEPLQLGIMLSEPQPPRVRVFAKVRFRNAKGAAITDLPLADLIPSVEENQNLLIVNRTNGRIVYSAPDTAGIGKPAVDIYPDLYSAWKGSEHTSREHSFVFYHADREQMCSFTSLDIPPWTVFAHLSTKKYLDDTRTTGGIALLASLILVAMCGLVIHRLVSRVKTDSAKLGKSNRLIADQNRSLSAELEKAHDLQMDLMPSVPPDISGYEVAGRCQPATHVGGDFFQYYQISESRWAITLADVTGHGMEAAIPSVLMSGMLNNYMESGNPTPALCGQLNSSLHRLLPRRTFVCFSMGDLNLHTNIFNFVNGGCPYPYLYRASSQQIEELTLDAFPLGLREQVSYQSLEISLEPGDRIIFCSDGIVEAPNEAEEIFGFDKTEDVVHEACVRNLSGNELIEHVFSTLNSHAFNTEQADDQTLVVVSRINR